MANFRIKVERLNDEVGLPEELERGIDVNGFTLLADVNDERSLQCVQHMSRADIASAIHGEEMLVSAALLSVVPNIVQGGADDE